LYKFSSNDVSNKDLRDAFFDELYFLGSKNKNLIILTNDMDAFALKKFKDEFPKQFINMGVVEQNIINVASGLSSCGKIVYVFGIASFVTFRCYEQIKFNICSRNLNVTIVGMGSGLSFGFDGPTHHSIQDIMAMNILPEMKVLSPSDANNTAACAHISYHYQGPNYIKIDKGVVPKIYNKTYNFDKGFKIVKPLGKNIILSTGHMTFKSIEIIKKLEQKKIKIGLIDIFNFNLFKSLISILFKNRVKKIFVIEENASNSGIAAILSNFLSSYENKIIIEKFALPNIQVFDYGSREWLHDKFGLTSIKILKKIEKKLI